MAPFNPNTGSSTNLPDQTSASRGTGPNRAFEALFSGLGDTIEAGVQTTDTFVQNTIEDDARYAFDSMNDEFTLSTDTVPAELTQSQSNLQRLAQAQAQGKVTPEYYYQRLAATMKGLRAKYPGYEKEVDNIVQRVTGERPANAYRDALLANINAVNRSAADSAGNFQKWVLQSGNIGYVQMAFPDYFDNPDKYTPEQIYSGVAKLKGQDQTWESQKLQIAGNKEFAGQALNERMNTVTATMLEGTSKALGMSGQSFMSALNDFSKRGGMTPDEKAQFNNQYEQFISNARTALIKETSDPAFVKLYSSSDLQRMREDALQPLLQIRDLIASDQYSQAALLVARNTNLQDQTRAALYKNDNRLATVEMLSKISPQSGEMLLNSLATDAGGMSNYLDKVAVVDVTAGIIAGDDTISDATTRVVDNKRMSAADKNAMAGEMVKKFTTSLKSGTLTPEEINRVVQNNYVLDGKDVFSMVDTSTDSKGNSQYLRLYNELFSPEITKKIKESGSSEAMQRYTDAAYDKFQAIPEFRKAAADLGENIDYARFLRGRYDEGSNRLILEEDRQAIENLGPANRVDNRGFIKRAVAAKDAMNQALSIVVPIIEANGGDETAGVQALIRDLSIDLEPQDRGGFYRWMNDIIDRGVTNITGTPNDASQGTESGEFTPLPYAEEGATDGGVTGSITPAQQAIENQMVDGNWKEIGATQTAQMPQGDISFLIPQNETLGKAASGKFTGNVDRFSGLTDPLSIAKKFTGLNETQHKKVIADFIRESAGLDINPAKTAWCAAFVNGVLGAAGGKGTGRLNARSFLNWGEPVSDPQSGDLVVFSRAGSSWKGHVGFYMDQEMRDDGLYIKVLGGNQSDSVSESWYPATRLLGYRRAES